MNFIDILIFIISVGGLIYFIFHRFKYSNKTLFTPVNSNAYEYIQNLEKLHALREEIRLIELHNNDMENLISNMNVDMYFDDGLTDKLINYRNNIDKLEILKFEYKKINLYLINSRPYLKEFFQ
jgi:cephalosporin-C deacetylase-like acetyl esterase